MDRPNMKPWIEGIHAYVPGKSRGEDGRKLIKLSANENPMGCSPAVLAALAQGHEPHLYPDPDATALREAIGALHGIDAARIVCGTGSGECLHGAVQAFAGPGDEVLFPRYSFSLYPLLAHKVGATDASGKRRLAMSLFASKADDAAQAVLPPYTVPPLWALKTLRGELPSALSEFFRSGVDRGLTGGEDGSGDPDDALFRA